jgi:hypothetical protein
LVKLVNILKIIQVMLPARGKECYKNGEGENEDESYSDIG